MGSKIFGIKGWVMGSKIFGIKGWVARFLGLRGG